MKEIGEANDLSPCLVIDKKAIANNIKHIQKHVHTSKILPVIKTNAYGVGAKEVAEILWQEGLKRFAVSTYEEAEEIQSVLPDAFFDVFYGLKQSKNLRPKNCNSWVNTLEELNFAKAGDTLHFDTGINRYGIPYHQAIEVTNNPNLENIRIISSHLSCADEKDHFLNKSQLERTKELQNKFNKPVSLASSAGLFLGKYYHFNAVRPGIALYGIMPKECGLTDAISLWAQILYSQKIKKGEYIGYGATTKAEKDMTIATVGLLGYADGLLRANSPIINASVGGFQCQSVGRISMDCITLDISDIPENIINKTNWVQIIPEGLFQNSINQGSTNHDTLVKLSNRVKRLFV